MKNILLAAIAATALTAALLLPATGHTAASAAPATTRLRCPAHSEDHGTSLARLSRQSGVPVPVLLWFAFRCSGYEGGGWTVRMSHYLEGADLRAPYRGWYWIGPLT